MAFEQFSQALSQPRAVTFVRVNIESCNDVVSECQVTVAPTIIYFLDGKAVERAQGVDPIRLRALIGKIAEDVKKLGETGGSASTSGSSSWRGADLPRGYGDITDQVELSRCELLNVDSAAGSVRVLFESSKPSALSGGKGSDKDWVESDTDEQLMLFVPFQSMLKLHTLQVL